MTDTVHILVVSTLTDQEIVAAFKDKQMARRYRNEYQEYINQQYERRKEMDYSEWLERDLKNKAGSYETIRDVAQWSDVWIESEALL